MPIFLSKPLNTNTNNTLVSNSLNLGNPTEDIDVIYIKGKNISTENMQNNISLSGGVGLGIASPEPHYDGFQYVYSEAPLSRLTGDIILNIISESGETAEIDKVYLLKKLFEFPDDDTFIRMDMGRTEVGAIIQEDLYYGLSKVSGKNKRRLGYTAERQEFEKARLFELFADSNKHFMFLEDFDFYPDRLYPAMLGAEVNTRYSIQNKLEGVDIDFEIIER